MRGIVHLLMVMLMIVVGSGCRKQPEHKSPETKLDLTPVEVKVHTISPKHRQAYEIVVGTVRSKLRAIIEAKVSGKIDSMLVEPGQEVKTGTLLATLDAREIQARYDQAKAVFEQASSELKRYTYLLEAKVTTQADYEARLAQYKVAEANLKEAETMLSYAKIIAPFDGVITRKIADVGDLAYPGKPILEMEDPQFLRFEANVPEALFDKVQSGAKYTVIIPALSIEIEGVVSEIAPVADPNTRTFLVKLDLPKIKGLRTGLFGRLKIPASQSAALRVPANAILVRGQMEIAFVVEGNVARLRLVKTGERVGDEIEVLSGVEEGEKIIISNLNKLYDGAPISIAQ